MGNTSMIDVTDCKVTIEIDTRVVDNALTIMQMVKKEL